MSNVEQRRRELFEAWTCGYRKKMVLRTFMHEGIKVYSEPTTSIAWQAFNAALDAVEIVLPRSTPGTYSDYYDACGDCRAAIESTNLGLKVK